MFIFGTHNGESNKKPEDGSGSCCDKDDGLIFGGSDDNLIAGTDGRDVISSGDGSDTIQAGLGSDLIFAGDGDDRVIHVASERAAGNYDFAAGGDGIDTLELVVTQAELQDAALIAEIEAFQQTLERGWGEEFKFESLNLKVQGFERLEINVIDTGNTPPEVVALESTLGEDGAAIAYDLLTGASDADGDALSVDGLPDEITTREGRVLVAGTDFETAGGQFTLTDAGRAMFNDLAADQTDEIVVAFQVSDGSASVANAFTLTITGENDVASISGATAGDVAEDGVLSATGTLAVSDPDDGEDVLVPQTGTAGLYGAFSITAGGVWTYVLANGSQEVQNLAENETVTDSFTVSSLDGTATETIDITITGAAEPVSNSAPVAVDDTFGGDEDGEITGNVLSNDIDADNDALTATLVSGVSNGQLTFNTDGSFTYVPDADFNGIDGFTYAATDGTEDGNTVTVTLDVMAVNDAPGVAAALVLSADEDGSLQTIDLLSGASDVDGDALSVANVSGLPAGATLVDSTLSIDPSDASYQSLAEGETVTAAIAYDVIDGNGGVTPQTLNVTINGVDEPVNNTAPVSVDDTFGGDEDGQISGNVLSNDTDADGDALTAALVSGVSNGQLDFNADGTFIYTPDADFNGTDSFSYLVSDGTENGNTATVTLDVTAANDAPVVGAALSLTADEDGAVQSIDLLSGATDVDGDALLIANVSDLPDGASLVGSTLSIDPSDSAYQSLAEGETITAAIAYDVIDGNGGVTSQTLNITITGANDDPSVGAALSLTADEDGPLQSIDLLSGATDVDGDALSVANVSPLSDGISLVGTILTVDPTDPAFDGLSDGETATVTVTYDVTDGNGGSAAQSVTVTVDGVTDGQPPATPTLGISASDQSALNETDAARVTLIGLTSPGAIVELQSADGTQVLASALADLDGEFRLPDIALDVGVSDFRVVARDPESGLESTAGTATFLRNDPDPDAPANAVLEWIEIALETISDSATTPDYASRALAMQSIAVQNALAAINGEDGYLFSFDGTGADTDLAVAYTAHAVLSGLFAGQSNALDQKLDDFVAAATGSGPIDITAQAAAQALGDAAAERILDFRRADGWDDDEIYIGSTEDGEWRPTGPAYFNALNPQWADLDPFTLAAGDQFRPDAPPSLLGDSIAGDAYDSDLARVRALGSADSTDRTADQTDIARFWADGSGTETPPGHWNRIAAQVSQAEGLSLSQSAELMLKLNLSLADAAIAAWDTKYAYDFWRPVTVLNDGTTIDLTEIMADPDWAPLLPTPAHPEYVSGHSTYSGAAATVLTATFGEDYTFTDTAETTSGDITRSFDGFWDAANEGGESRIFGGIHFDFSNFTGLALGSDVANWVLQSFDPLNDVIDPSIVLTNLDPDAVAAAPVIEGILTDNLSGALRLIAIVNDTEVSELTVDAFGNFSFDPGPLDDGFHTIEFIGQDAAGNTGGVEYEFAIASTPPAITLTPGSISDTNGALAEGARIIGDIDIADGATVAALTVQIDGGPVMPLNFDDDGLFDAALQIGALAPGAHTVTLRVIDTAGNETVETIDATLAERPPFRVLDLLPDDRESSVGATIHPFVQFNRAVDPATLDSDSFYAVTATGERVPANITLLNDGTGAWMFFDEPLPGSTAIELIVDGDLIRAADGAALDGDADGAPGGALVQRFTTVALEGLETTTLTGRIVDPGADLFMMTPDDFTSGPGGVTDYANHQYRSPIEGAEVYVLGRPDLAVVTGADGSFELTGLPSGRVKIVVDGRTATNAPSDIYWPEMVLDVEIRPGQANTIMGGMGPLEAQLERQEDQALFLPRIPVAALTEVPDDAPITIRPVTAAGTDLTPEQFDLISLEVQPNSMIDAQGNPILNPELGLAIVPSDMVIDMLPDGVPVPPIFLTIQGPDGGVFTEEAVLTIPNVFGLAPGEKTEFFSYDHQTGLLVVNGVGTVSEDGTFIQTDPGSGILQPGWNGPIRISRIVVDPQLPCPPNTNHPENTDPNTNNVTSGDILDATNTLIGNRGAIETAAEIVGRADLRGGPTPSSVVGNALALRDDSNRLQNTLNIMADAWYADDPGPLGGEVDAGFWGIMGLQLAGDVSRTAVHSFSAIVQNVPGLQEFRPVSKTLDATIAGADLLGQVTGGQNPLEPVTRIVEKVQDRAEDTSQNGISGKFSSGSPEADRFQEVADDAGEHLVRLEELQQELEELQQISEDVREAAEDLQRINDEVIENIRDTNAPTDQEIERLVGPQGGDPLQSEFGDAYIRFVEASEQAADVGNLDRIIYEIYGILADVTGAYDDAYGEAEGTISLSDLQVPPSQVDGEYEISYGPVQYVLLTNIDTGEEQRFTLRSGETPLQPTSPGANYVIEIFDPVSGFTGASTFVAPRPFAVNSLTNFALLPRVEPILNSTAGEPAGPGGLTEQQAHIVGADFSMADSLLPGTNITDRQALISGLGSSPGSVNLNGVTGQLSLEGTAEAVAIGGSSANGAGLTAYVATGDLGLAIVDVSNSLQPILLGQIDLPGFAEDVASVDQMNLVAVALGEGGLAVVDVRDPVRPVLDAVYDTVTVTQVIAIGDRLIVAQDGRVVIIDAASGVELASIGVGIGPDQQFEALAYEDGQIYALGDDGNLHIVSLDGTDLTNRGVIDLAGELLDLPDSPQIATQDGVLWIGSTGTGSGGGVRGGMVTIDATDPDAPALVGDINVSNTASDFAGDSVAVNGSGFGVASRTLFDTGTNSESRLTVFNSRDPADNENEVTEYRFDGETRDIAIAAGEAFVATGSEGLQIVRFLGIDTQGTAPTISATTLPEDVDDAVAGLQVFQGQTLTFDVATDDDIQVRSVDVIINGNTILSTVAYPWDLTVTLPTIEEIGTDLLDIQFRATDTGGNSTTTDPVQIQMVADVTPFEILDITPDDGDSLLPGAVRSITITFSKSVESDTVNSDTFQLTGPAGTLEPASISVRASGTEVQLTYPAGSFDSGAFALTIDADNVTDRAGTPLAASDVTSSFDIQVVDGQTWIGITDGTWNDPVNWSSGRAPETGDDVVLPMPDGVTATISATAGDMNSVNVSGTGTLRVLTEDTGTDLTAPTLSNTGNIDVALGQVEISAQTVNSGDLAVTSTLVQNNSGQTVALPGELELTGSFTNTGVFRASEGGQIDLDAPVIDNQFEIRVENGVADLRASNIQTAGALTELTGGGTLILDTEAGSTRIASVTGSVGTAEQGVIDETFRNVDNTITGTGKIGAGFVLENTSGGLIEARDGDNLRITSGRVDNDGVMQALDGGNLTFDSEQFAFFGGLFGFLLAPFIDNQDGTILADGGQVNFTNSTVSGGLLQATNGGFFTMFSSGNSFARLDGGTAPITIQGQLIATSLVQTEGTIDNQGFLSTGLGPSFAVEIQIIEDTTFTGGGQINLLSGDVASDDRVATIINDFEVLYDEETGEVLFDEFGQVQVEYETRMSLQDQRLTGSGRVGTSEEEGGGEFGSIPLFKIDLSSGSEIDANQPDDILEFLNTELTLASGTTMQSSSGGILRFVDSDVFNFGDVQLFGGGEILFELGSGSSTGGFFFNDGDVNIFDGLLYSDVTLFNRGNLNIIGGEADLSFLSDDVANGGRTTIGDASLTIREGASANLDVRDGDAAVIVENSSNFNATVFDFEAGDAFHFTDLDDSGAAILAFSGFGNSGTLSIDDGGFSFDLELISTGGSFAGVTEDDFSLSESEFGGLVLETSLEFI